MEIEIIGPVFKCREDEEIFFMRLSEVTGCEKVLGQGVNLYLSISSVEKQVVFKEVQEICDIWNTSYKVSKVGHDIP